MTLKEWADRAGVLATHPTTERGAVSMIVPWHPGDPNNWDLWHLEDYLVSSVCGPLVWLLPRTKADAAFLLPDDDADELAIADMIAEGCPNAA